MQARLRTNGKSTLLTMPACNTQHLIPIRQLDCNWQIGMITAAAMATMIATIAAATTARRIPATRTTATDTTRPLRPTILGPPAGTTGTDVGMLMTGIVTETAVVKMMTIAGESRPM